VHCDDCIEHNKILNKYERNDLSPDLFNYPGWDPISYVTDSAYRYLFPRLCELAYGVGDLYQLDHFIFHLPRRLLAFSKAERDTIKILLDDLEVELSKEIDFIVCGKQDLDMAKKKIEEIKSNSAIVRSSREIRIAYDSSEFDIT